MSGSLLIDTCAAIWIVDDESISTAATKAIDEAGDQDLGVFISPITAWELGQLVSKGRLALPMTPDVWFDRLIGVRGTRLAEMPPDLLIASHFLPGAAFRDPADRIIVATARAYDYTLITRDRAMLRYADEGHVKAIAC